MVTAIQHGPRREIAAVDRAARRLGLRPGMTVAQAQASIHDLLVIDADLAGDADGLTRLAAWCLRRYSPLVATDPPDGLWIEIAGSADLFQGEAGLLDDLERRVVRSGICIRAAVADTPGAAWAVARFRSRKLIVSPGMQVDAVAELPVRALRLAPETAAGLVQLGIERIGQLAAKPRAAIKMRFEDVLLRLDQAFGQAPEPLAYLTLPGRPEARLAFAEPIATPESLQFTTRRLLTRIEQDLERRCLGARRLDLVFRRVDGVTQAVRVGTARPTRNVTHLARLCGEKLALVDPGFGIDEATLVVSVTERLDPTQAGLNAADEPAAAAGFGELVDRLTVRVGPGRVYRAAPVASAIPERSVRRVHPFDRVPPEPAWPAGLPRPARLLAPPEQVAVVALAPDHPPAVFVWRRVRYRVGHADGPERITGEWWVSDEETGLVRDYYRVETIAGDRFWLFRDAPAAEGGRWWLHGIGEA